MHFGRNKHKLDKFYAYRKKASATSTTTINENNNVNVGTIDLIIDEAI